MVAITDAASDAAAAIQSAGTIIIKIGSSLLVEDAHGAVNAIWLAGVASDIAMLREAGKNVFVVSSGAIALGHPLGASGARLMTTLVHRMRRENIRFGLQTMCEGGGMANATVVELLSSHSSR